MVISVTQIRIGIIINVGVSAKFEKNIICTKKLIFWNLATCTWENGKYLGSIIGNSVITCNEIGAAQSETLTTRAKSYGEVTKTTSSKAVPTNFKEKEVTCKINKNYIFYYIFY